MEDIPGQEQDIYRKLCSIRDRFMSEKTHSRSTVDSSWKVVNSLVKDLFKLRSESEDRILNPVDLVIEDLVPLFLQFWSSCDAVSKDLFPIYVKAAKHLHQLNQSKISGLFTIQELTDRQTSLREISLHAKALYSMEGDTNTQGISMVCDKLLKCGSILLMTDSLLQSLQNEFDGISSVLKPIHDKLVAIKRELNLLICRKSPHAYSLAEVQLLQNELGEIEMARIDGKYISTDGNVVQGQASVIDLLEACFDDVHELLASRDEITGKNPLRPVYESLINIRSRLDNMNFSSTWGVRSHELNVLQAELGEIDNLRVDGKFMDAEGNCPIGQAILHFQLHKCYRLIYKLQLILEPVSENLMHIYNQLLTLDKCVHELSKWKMSLTDQELLPYHLKLRTMVQLVENLKSEDDISSDDNKLLQVLLVKCKSDIEQLKME